VIAEGIESSASAGQMLGLPAWAAISAGNLGYALALPLGVRRITIAVDADDVGRNAAQAAACRWRAERRIVRFVTPDVGDFNDVALAHREADA
jgi:hypothetical protein